MNNTEHLIDCTNAKILETVSALVLIVLLYLHSLVVHFYVRKYEF